MSNEIINQENPLESKNPAPSKSKIPNVTILNVALLVGLLVLYALQFYRGSSEKGIGTETEAQIADLSEIVAEGSFLIAFVNSDSLMANYKLAQKMRSDFETEQKRMETDLQRREQTFQADVESFQRQVQLGMFTQESGQAKEQELMLRQQELIQLRDTYTSRLMAREVEMNRELYANITNLLERFNKETEFDYILGFSPGGGILYANKKHDITLEILNRLNQEYEIQR